MQTERVFSPVRHGAQSNQSRRATVPPANRYVVQGMISLPFLEDAEEVKAQKAIPDSHISSFILGNQEFAEIQGNCNNPITAYNNRQGNFKKIPEELHDFWSTKPMPIPETIGRKNMVSTSPPPLNWLCFSTFQISVSNPELESAVSASCLCLIKRGAAGVEGDC